MKRLSARTRSQGSHFTTLRPFFSNVQEREAATSPFFTTIPAIAVPFLQPKNAEGEPGIEEVSIREADVPTISSGLGETGPIQRQGLPSPKKIGQVAKGTILTVLESDSAKPSATDFCRAKEDLDLFDNRLMPPLLSYKVKGPWGEGYVNGPTTLDPLDGIVAMGGGNYVFNHGQPGGSLDPSAINCLGHASGAKSAALVKQERMSDMLAGLGFKCTPGSHAALAAAIGLKKPVMMVYLYLYKPSWRTATDRPLSFPDLAKKYGWTKASWKENNVFFSASGADQPIDYHAITFNYASNEWEWVGHLKPKKANLTYDLDSQSTNPAAKDPDVYFPAEQVLVSLACVKE